MAQNDLSAGVKLYNESNYERAILFFKNATKFDSSDSNAWYYLGLSQIGDNKLKDAEKSLKKSISINPNNFAPHSALAYLYLLKNKNEDAKEAANASLKLNKQDIDANYVLGVVYFRDGFYNNAYGHAKKIVEVNPSFAAAYLLKAECLISSFIQQSGTVLPPINHRSQLLKEAKGDLEKYISLSPKSKDITFYTEYLDSIKFFAEYYSDLGVKLPASADAAELPEVNTIPLKVLTKPRPNYTELARQAGVSGIVTLLVNFSETGTVKNVLVLKPLGFGLDQEAIRAVQKIKFEPVQKNGKPVAVVKTVQYKFTLF
jgi:TonB family protein